MSVSKFLGLAASFAVPIAASQNQPITNSAAALINPEKDAAEYVVGSGEVAKHPKDKNGVPDTKLVCTNFLGKVYKLVPTDTTHWADHKELQEAGKTALKKQNLIDKALDQVDLSNDTTTVHDEPRMWECIAAESQRLGDLFAGQGKTYMQKQIEFRSLSFMYFYFVTHTLAGKSRTTKDFNEGVDTDRGALLVKSLSSTTQIAGKSEMKDAVVKVMGGNLLKDLIGKTIKVGTNQSVSLLQLLVSLLADDKGDLGPKADESEKEFLTALKETDTFFNTSKELVATAISEKTKCDPVVDSNEEVKSQDTSDPLGVCHKTLEGVINSITVGLGDHNKLVETMSDSHGSGLSVKPYSLYALETALKNLDVTNSYTVKEMAVMTIATSDTSSN